MATAVAAPFVFLACSDDDPGGTEGEGEGEGDGAVLTLDPIFNDFGSTPVGSSGNTIDFTVKNAGTAAAGTVTFATQGDFVVAASSCGPLDAGATCTISVKFAPSSAGVKPGSLTVTANPGGTAIAALSGVGTTPGSLTISNTPATYGSVLVGETGPAQTFTVTNTGGSATAALTAGLGGDSAHFSIASDGCTAPLAAGASCSVEVAFAPTSPGLKAAALGVRGAAGEEAYATLNGTGILPAALAISPNRQSFGSAALGAQGSTLTFTVSNTGGVASGAIATEITGDADAFEILSSGCGAALAPGASCPISVIFAPATAGEKTATLSVTASPGGTQTAQLFGTGLAAGQLTIDPTASQFADTVLGSTTAAVTLTVRNSGGAPTGVLAAGLTGADASSFTIIPGSNTCQGAILAAGLECSVAVAFSPASVGAKTARFTVTGNPGGSAFTDLSGTGLAQVNLVATPTFHDFGTVNLTEQSAPRTFAIQNTGGVAAGALTETLTGGAGQFSILANGCTALAAQGSCDVTVAYAPVTTGSHAATLTLSTTGGQTVGISLTGEGTEVQISVKTIDDKGFRNFDGANGFVIGTDSPATAFIVENKGQGLTDIEFALAGSHKDDFVIDTTTALSSLPDVAGISPDSFPRCGTSLGASASCAVLVRFAPTSTTSPGSKYASLEVTATPGGTVRAALSGTALEKFKLVGIHRCTDGIDVDQVVDSFVPGNAACSLVKDDTGQNDLSLPFDFGKFSANADITEFTPPSYSFQFEWVEGDAQTPASTKEVAQSGAFTRTNSVASQFPVAAETCSNPTGLAAGVDCYVGVQFVPTGPTGPRSGSFTLASTTDGVTSTTDLVGTAIGSLLGEITNDDDNTTLETAEFTDIQAGTQSPGVADPIVAGGTKTVRFNFTNTGTVATSRIDVTLGGNDFFIAEDTCDGIPTLSGASCYVDVRFSPRAPGSYTGALVVTDGPQTLEYALEGRAVAGASLSVSETSYNFGSVVDTRTSATKTFTVTNTGERPANTINIALSDPKFVRLAGTPITNCGASLAAGASCTIDARYEPGAGTPLNVGSDTVHTATLTVTSSAPTATVTLTGTATPRLTLSPATATLPDTVTTFTSTPTTLTVTNVGSVAATVTADAIDGNDTGTAVAFTQTGCGASVAPNGTCTLTVAFAPTAGVGRPFAHQDVLRALIDASPIATAALTGTELSPATLIINQGATFAPGTAETADFGSFLASAVGGNTRTFTLKNIGGAPTAALSQEILGAGASRFSVTRAESCTTLAPGQECTFDVTYAVRTAVVAPIVADQAELTWGFVGAGNGVASVDLTAITLSDVVADATLSFNPRSYVFAATEQGANGPTRLIRIVKNHATTETVTATSGFEILTTGTTCIDADNTAANGWQLNGAIPAGCDFNVRFKPNAVGEITGRLQSTSGGGPNPADAGGYAALYGIGLASANLQITTDGALFTNPSIAASATGTEIFTVKNDGEVTSPTFTIAIDQNSNKFSFVNGAADACVSGSTTLAPGASCTITVRFTPVVAQAFTGTLSVTPAGGTALTQSLNATAVNDASLTVTATAGDPGVTFATGAYGDVAVGDRKSIVYEVENTGGGTTGLLTLTSGAKFLINDAAAAAALSVTDLCVSGVSNLQANGICRVVLTYVPTVVTATAETNTLSVDGAGPGVGLISRTQTGRGINALAITGVGTFAATTVNNRSAATTFTISNVSGITTGPLTVSTTDDFVLSDDPCSGTTLAAGATCFVEVEFAPSATGARTGTLNVSATPGGTATQNLGGTGQ